MSSSLGPVARAAAANVAGQLLNAARSGTYRLVVSSVGDRPVGAHVTRYAMYGRLAAVGDELGVPNDAATRVLSISRSEGLCAVLGLDRARIEKADFPSFDLRSLDFGSETFDALVADQVLEHVEADPSVPVRESFRVVRPGGLVVHTTCFINPIHEDVDLFRFTPSALAMLFEPHGELVEVGGWGNRVVWLLDAIGLRFQPVPHDPNHPLHRIAIYDEPAWPIVTWVVARKR